MTQLNQVREFNCDACTDEGGFEICDPSTDALTGWVKCDSCPTMPPVWKPVEPWYRTTWKRTPAELAAEAACPF